MRRPLSIVRSFQNLKMAAIGIFQMIKVELFGKFDFTGTTHESVKL